MKKFYFTFFISMLLPIGVIHAQVLRITASSTESTCSNNGQICVRTTGGHRPYQYELDRIGSNLHLSQTDSCFVGLSKGNYKIRVTDALNNKDSVMVAVLGNYVLPSLTATVAGSCVTLNVIGGRKPFRYYYSPLSGGQQIAINLVATDSTTQTICCLANNTYWFKMEDSCQNIYPFRITVPVVAPPTIRVDTTYVNDSLTISLIRSLYGEPPYQFKCVGDSRGERINSTGIFTGLKGCSFVVTITDRCGRTDSRTVDNVAALTFTLLCSNSDIGTASMSARGGMPPYIFTELNSNLTNTTGLFTKLPLHQPYRFRVTDSCGKTIDRDISPFTSSASWQGCPFTNQIQLHSYNPSSSYSGYSWYPITYTCMSCTPIVTLVDSGRGSNYGESNANFINVPAGTHHFKVSNHCGAIHELDVTTDTTDVYVYLNYRNCHNNQVLVTSNGNFFVLKNKLGVPIDSNGTGLFNLFTNDTVIISARRDGCEGHPEIRILPTQLSINAYLNCDARTITASSSGDSMLFVLKNKAGHPIDSNSIGIFNILTIDTFRVAVRNRSCLGNQITVYPPVVRDTAKFCLTLARNSNRYIWNMRLSPTSDVNRTHTYRLRGGPNAINLFDDHYYYCDFNNLLPGVYTLEYDCIAKTIILPVPDTSYQLQLTTEPSCPQTTTIVARYIRNQTWTHWAIQNNVSLCDTLSIHYALYDSYGNYLGSNYTGRFDLNELPNRLYQVSLLSNYSNYPLKIDTIRTPPYERAIVTASFDTACIADAFGKIRLRVAGGIKPYTYEILEPSQRQLSITTDSSGAVFNQIPVGIYRVRAYDRCRISSDFTGTIERLISTARSQRKCDSMTVLTVTDLSGATYCWKNVSGDTLGQQRTITIQDTARRIQTYFVEVKWNGCVWIHQVSVPRDTIRPIQMDTMICAGRGLWVYGRYYNQSGFFKPTMPNQFGCDSLITHLNLKVQTVVLDTFPDIIRCEGNGILRDTIYYNIKRNQQGCDSVIQRTRLKVIPHLSVTMDSVPTCVRQPIGTLSVRLQNRKATTVRIRWSTGDTTLIINRLAAGSYTVTVIDQLGCSDTFVKTIQLLPPRPLWATVQTVDICQGKSNGIATVSVRGGTPPYRYQWSDSSRTTAFANALKSNPNPYVVTVTDVNHCDTQIAFRINELSIYKLDTTFHKTLCKGDTFWIYNRPFTDTRTEFIKPLAGCDTTIQVFIDFKETNPLLRLNPVPRETTIQMGDSIQLKLNPNFKPITIRWKPNSCVNCLTIEVKPFSDQTYFVEAQDSQKCVMRDSVLVKVKRGYYDIPNAYYHHKGANYTVYPDKAIQRIERLRIYDRWGTLIYDSALEGAFVKGKTGWNGTFRDEPAPIGVYVAVVDTLLESGDPETITSDLILIR